MKELFEIYQAHHTKLKLTLEIYHSSIVDWCISIKSNDAVVCDVQSCDYELAFAKAQVELKEWLSENNGGY